MPDDPKPAPKPDDKKTFTQEDLDRIVADRLKRESAKYSDYDELKLKAAKLDDAEQKTKTENQKLLDRIEAAEKKAADAEKKSAAVEADALRLRVAHDKGLTPAQAKRLQGTTREELEADADDLLETFPAGKDDGEKDPKGARPPGRPREDLRGGGKPDDDKPVETDPAKLAENVPRF